MVHTIYSKHVLPDIDTHQQAFNETRNKYKITIKEEINERLFAPESKAKDTKDKSLISRIFKLIKKRSINDNPKDNQKTESSGKKPREIAALEHWQQSIDEKPDSHRRVCEQSIHRVVSAIVAHHGRIVNQPDLITTIATNLSLNQIGTDLARTIVEPIFKSAVQKEKFRWLPVQEHPVVMNVKGASASGKSTIRPQQRQLAGELDIPWEDFALISPDYWRKYLLDYESLGADYKYAAMLTGQELEIVDKKLDNYMAEKTTQGELTHL